MKEFEPDKIVFGTQLQKEFSGKTITILNEPKARSGEFLATLEAWQGLPEIITVPDAARFISHACKQNCAAITKAIEQAILDRQIDFFGLHSSGHWKLGMVRVLFRNSAKPRVRLGSDGCAEIGLPLDSSSRLHIEVMGVRLGDVLGLLVRRGRKIPAELLHLVAHQPPASIGGGSPISRSKAQENAILEAIGQAGYEPLKLPARERGKAGVKSEVWKVLQKRKDLFVSKKVYDTAWERLRSDREIIGAD